MHACITRSSSTIIAISSDNTLPPLLWENYPYRISSMEKRIFNILRKHQTSNQTGLKLAAVIPTPSMGTSYCSYFSHRSALLFTSSDDRMLHTHTHTHTHTLHHSHDYVPGELQLGNIETKENIAYGPITACNPQQSDPDAEYEEIPNEAQPHIELQENPAYGSV